MNNESVRENAERKWRDIMRNGRLLLGISENITPEKPPLWFDENKFVRSQQLARKYYMSLLFSQFTGLILGLHHPEALAPLLATGNSSNVAKLFRRYLSTIIHVKYWYEYNPFEENSKSYKSLRQVISMHRKVIKSMNNKSNRVERIDHLWMSQHSMAHTQFAFIGFVALFPKQCGLHSLSNYDFDCLLFFWRVIGYCLGIDDRFNICSGNTEEIVELCKLMYWNEWHPVISAETPAAPVGVEMGKGVCLAVNSILSPICWRSLMKYWYPILDIPKSVALHSFTEKFSYHLIRFHMNHVTKLSLFQWMASSKTRFHIATAGRLKERKEKRLAKKYINLSYDNGCPFDVNFNYVDVFKIKESQCSRL